MSLIDGFEAIERALLKAAVLSLDGRKPAAKFNRVQNVA
jgi:hypothetical protein